MRDQVVTIRDAADFQRALTLLRSKEDLYIMSGYEPHQNARGLYARAVEICNTYDIPFDRIRLIWWALDGSRQGSVLFKEWKIMFSHQGYPKPETEIVATSIIWVQLSADEAMERGLRAEVRSLLRGIPLNSHPSMLGVVVHQEPGWYRHVPIPRRIPDNPNMTRISCKYCDLTLDAKVPREILRSSFSEEEDEKNNRKLTEIFLQGAVTQKQVKDWGKGPFKKGVALACEKRPAHIIPPAPET